MGLADASKGEEFPVFSLETHLVVLCASCQIWGDILW